MIITNKEGAEYLNIMRKREAQKAEKAEVTKRRGRPKKEEDKEAEA